MTKSRHPDHQNKLSRLNRIAGQLRGIIKMVEDKKYCVDILQQTRAVTSAIKSVEQLILKDHMNACVFTAIKSNKKNDQENKIEEIVNLLKKFN